jgi:hypothetical protein
MRKGLNFTLFKDIHATHFPQPQKIEFFFTSVDNLSTKVLHYAQH